MKPEANYCFEVSWEAANKVGGIYTVIKSKVRLMQENYPNYYLIGPYIKDHSERELDIQPPPAELLPVFTALEEEGIKCIFGKWQTPGNPNVILIDSTALSLAKDEWRKFWWENFQIDSINAHWDFDEPMLWATAVGRLLEKSAELLDPGSPKVAHFHEWLSGFGLLWIKHNNVPMGTVFTTHATMLGRSIASTGQDLYALLPTLDPEASAREHNVSEKFSTERACAREADVFTTVSATTALEAEVILGRKPEVLVLNGLDSAIFPTMEDLSILHRETRDKMRNFFSYYFSPYENQQFDLEHTLAFFMVGRYEYHNKGIDHYLKALAKLNHQLQEEGSDRTVVAFIWVPSGVNGSRMDLLESKNYYRQIRDHVESRSTEINQNLIRALIAHKDVQISDVLDKDFLQSVKKDVWRFRRDGTPPLSTHYLSDEGNDPIIRELNHLGLTNQPTDRVKVIFYPVYLDGQDGLLNLSYYDAMAACHLGVFPSYYEPWGYTPIESAAMGVPAVTTDLSGCGMYLEERIENPEVPGIWVLKRRNRTDEEAIEDLYKVFHQFVGLDHQQRVEHKIAAKQLVDQTDWRELVHNYFAAHNLALSNMAKRR